MQPRLWIEERRLVETGQARAGWSRWIDAHAPNVAGHETLDAAVGARFQRKMPEGACRT